MYMKCKQVDLRKSPTCQRWSFWDQSAYSGEQKCELYARDPARSKRPMSWGSTVRGIPQTIDIAKHSVWKSVFVVT